MVVLAAVVVWVHRYLHRAPSASRARHVAEFFRMALPFIMCIAVYTHLHDTVRFVAPRPAPDGPAAGPAIPPRRV